MTIPDKITVAPAPAVTPERPNPIASDTFPVKSAGGPLYFSETQSLALYLFHYI